MQSGSANPVSISIKATALAATVSLFVLLACALPTSALAAECTDTWTGPAEGTWQTAENWSTGHVPSETDVACIGSGKTAKVTSGTNKVGIVQGEGSLTIIESTLELKTTAEASSIKSFSLLGGTLTGAGTLDVSTSLYWSGTMSGTGSTVLLSGGTGSIEGGGHTLKERTLVNKGTIAYESGYIEMREGGRIENTGTFNANSPEVSGIVQEGEGVTPVFVNTGTVQKTTGTGETRIGVDLENKGTLNAKSGTISLDNKKTESTFASGSVVEGTILISAGTVKGANFTDTSGTVTVSEGQLSMESGRTGAIANLVAGSITGAGTLDVSKTFSWAATSSLEGMSGSGSTVLLPGTTGTIEGGGRNIKQRTLVNEGTLTWTSGYIEMREGAELKNVGTFNANSSNISGIVREGTGATPKIVNTGTFRKVAETERTDVEVEFVNEGLVQTKVGTMNVTGGGSSINGTWSAAEGSLIALSKGSMSFNGGSLEGPISISEMTATAESLVNHHLALTITGSVYTSEGSLTVVKGSMAVESLNLQSSGKLTGAGNLEVEKSFVWSGGTLSGTGTTVLLTGGTGSIEGGGHTIKERTLISEGTATFTSYYIEMREGAQLVNRGTFNDNAETFGIVPEGSGTAPLIVNRGTYTKSSGEGTSTVDVNFENLGNLSNKVHILHPVMKAHTEHFGTHCDCNEPVDASTGDYSETQTDFEIGGRGVGLDLTRTYDAQSGATATSPGAFGYGWTNSFSDHLISEESGKKITVVQSEGSTVPFAESGKESFSAPTWSQDTLSGSSEAGYTLTLPEQTKYRFSGAGRLEKVTDRNGNETTLAYNKSGQLETITDPAGRKITLTYNGEGLVESAKDPMGHVVKYTYESKNLASVTMPGETEPRWKFKYDGSHRMTTMTDGRGGKLTNEYDSSNRVISQTDPAERATTFEYNAFETKITNKATGAVTQELFTSNNEPYSITRGYGTALATTETFTYNGEGRMLSRTDGDGHETTYGYDSHGNRTSMVNPDKGETTWTYNEHHEVETETTPSGEKTTIKREGHGNPETISRPAPGKTTQTTKYTYTAHGQVETMTNPLSKVWKYEYDSAGDRTAEIDPESDKRTWAYNEDSQVTSMVSPRGNETGAKPAEYTTTYELDAQGRPIKVTNPLGHETKYAYDANGNLESETDPNAHKTKYNYNADNQLTKVEKPNGNVLETEYDGAGQVKSQTDGNKHTTTYVRNVLEEPTEITDPLARKTIDEYDAAGNLKASIDPLKRETTYVYDPDNRLKEIKYSDGITPTDKYEYNADGYLTHMTDGTGESTFTYDQLDRLTESKDGHGDTAKYEYNLGNQQTKITYPNEKSVTQAFDSAGRLKSVTDWLEHKTTFAYNRDNEVNKITFPTATGNVDTYAYSHADLMSEAKMAKGETTIASLVYARNKAGLVESTTSKGLPGVEKTSYTYDENNRLTKAGTASYEYDAANNLTNAPGTTNTYNKANELETGTNVSYTYNEMGQRTKMTPSVGPATSYGYDQAGNLTSVKRPLEGATPEINDSYAYNGQRLMASRTVSGVTSYLTWDATSATGGQPLILSDGHNSYIYGPGGYPVEQVSSGETPTYCHYDQLGSTRLLTNASGAATGTFTYGAYGALEGSTGTQTTPLGYAGQDTEADSGLQYLRARFYDPATGQLLTRDPAEVVTRSTYGYAAQDPANYVDPTGTKPVNSPQNLTHGESGFGPLFQSVLEDQLFNDLFPSGVDPFLFGPSLECLLKDLEHSEQAYNTAGENQEDCTEGAGVGASGGFVLGIYLPIPAIGPEVGSALGGVLGCVGDVGLHHLLNP